jgi:WhiB family transcriptional regulator, redox-sensing transcriptional regulator
VPNPGTPLYDAKTKGVAETEVFVRAWRTVEAHGYELPCTTGGDYWTSEDQADRDQAVKLCRPCLIRTVCLTAARARGERHGVWGKDLTIPTSGAKIKKAAAA